MNAAIYPGTFDPVTLGHLDVMHRAAKIFDRLVVAVVASGGRKKPWFTTEDRVAFIRESAADIPNIEVEAFSGLLVDYVRGKGVGTVVRGLRAFADFEYEFQMALTNRKLAPDVDTIFLMTAAHHSFISSTGVREVAELGGDTSGFVHPAVQRALLAKRAQATGF